MMCVMLTGQREDLCAEAGEFAPVGPAGEERHTGGTSRVFDLRT